MFRLRLVRWILSKLLGGFFVCSLLYWVFPAVGLDWRAMSFWELYSWITSTLLLAGLTSYLLVTPPKLSDLKKRVLRKDSSRTQS